MNVLALELEQELIQRLQARDEAAMTHFYQRYKSALLQAIWQIVRQRELAEDVLQETMLKFWLGFSSYDSEKARLFTWALRIAQNLAIDRLRERHRGRHLTHPLEDNMASSQAAPVSFRPEHLGIRECLRVLPSAERHLLDLLYWQGYTQSEAAQELAIPLGTVKSRNRRAIRLLARMVT